MDGDGGQSLYRTDDATTYKLLPCPFCGGGALIEKTPMKGTTYNSIGCESRECRESVRRQMYGFRDDETLQQIEKWNTRAGTSKVEV